MLRPRLAFYGVLGLVGAVVAIFAFRSHEPYEANLLRLAGPPYVIEDGTVRNSFNIHLVNKRDTAVDFELEPVSDGTLDYTLPMSSIRLGPLEDRNVPIFVRARRERTVDGLRIRVEVRPGAAAPRVVSAPFVGPSS